MSAEIKNKIAVVTGGAKGIGYAIAEEFLNQGAKIVFIVDLNENQGTETAKTLNSKYGDAKAVFIKCDITKDLDKIYEDIVSKCPSIDILVNNAGVFNEHSLRKTIETNTVATVEWSMKFLENMRKDKGGKGGVILNVSSIYGYIVDELSPFYKASKYAVMGFSRTLGHATNYNVTGVKVLVICPGITNTDILMDIRSNEALAFNEQGLQEAVSTMPSQEKEDVAKAAVKILENGRSGSAWSIIGGELQLLE
ncbi:15-hydroxyprostaglandin dehydrogenase [NAD(+)]-like [Ostrinia furnacalis]|uniref:15-hydroxyprostaglandin dehydrogenase [NAD(+)]-like n=1 Tax=Ostrinia furnacalis TaxID=93504 RepID=UPI00103E81A6|nr:15-hydroxyprostaglandin dehydrogenase [NAD(+)]-like [Ostrinia furnacalis]